MRKIKQLIKDLEVLNKNYLELTSWEFEDINTEEDLENQNERDIKAGKLFVDFYNNKFVPEYSESKKIPKEILGKIERYIAYLSSTASMYIEKKNFFGLGVLLTDMGSKISDPNNLEKFIQDLKKN